MRRLELEVAVIGGGVAGLTCADALARSGGAVTVFDKGRGPGGRASHRREGKFRFEHGAPGADALIGQLAATVPVQSRQRVDALWPRPGGGWGLLRGGSVLGQTYDLVVVAVPANQASEILRAAPALSRLIRNVEMDPCLTAMVGFSRPLGVSWHQLELARGPLRVARRQSSAGDGHGAEAWVLHGAADFNRARLDDDPDRSARWLFSAFAHAAEMDLPDPVYLRGHRWRYASTRRPLGVDSLYVPDSGLGVCGDWCRGSRVLDARTSGRALARRILAHHLERPQVDNQYGKERAH